LSLLFVGNAHAENQSTTDYKIEQIKEDIKKLETDLTKLEDDVDESKDNKLENKKDLESLDKRVGDINLGITLFSIFITVLLLGFGFFTYRNAKADAKEVAKKEAEEVAKATAQEATKEWTEIEGKVQLEPIVRKLEEEAQKEAEDGIKKWIENEGNRQLETIIKKLEEKAKKEVEKVQMQIKEAVNIAKQDIERQSKAKKLFLEGYTHYSNKEYLEAIDCYKQAIDINPKDDIVYSNMGVVYDELKEYDKAIQAYQKAIEINLKKDEIYYNPNKFFLPDVYLKNINFKNRNIVEIQISDKWYYVKSNGEAIVTFSYENRADRFKEGLARTEVNGKIGFFNQNLEVIIKPIYDFAFPFHDGVAEVCIGCNINDTQIEGGIWKKIDKNGLIVD